METYPEPWEHPVTDTEEQYLDRALKSTPQVSEHKGSQVAPEDRSYRDGEAGPAVRRQAEPRQEIP